MPTSQLLFGWCLPYSRDHSTCATEFTFEGKQVVCQCKCHTTKTNDEDDEFESERKFNEE